MFYVLYTYELYIDKFIFLLFAKKSFTGNVQFVVPHSESPYVWSQLHPREA